MIAARYQALDRAAYRPSMVPMSRIARFNAISLRLFAKQLFWAAAFPIEEALSRHDSVASFRENLALGRSYL